MGRNEGSVVLLSESRATPALKALQAEPEAPVAAYDSVESLLRGQPLSSIAVLVVQTRAVPSGMLLLTLGRLGIEFPEMRKVVVMDGPPPLPVAGYLTGCGADLMWAGGGEPGTDQLAAVVNRMREQTRWVA